MPLLTRPLVNRCSMEPVACACREHLSAVEDLDPCFVGRVNAISVSSASAAALQRVTHNMSQVTEHEPATSRSTEAGLGFLPADAESQDPTASNPAEDDDDIDIDIDIDIEEVLLRAGLEPRGIKDATTATDNRMGSKETKGTTTTTDKKAVKRPVGASKPTR